MNVSIYKTPYQDPLHPHLIRLLFESRPDAGANESTFYLYIWLTEDGVMHSLQGVCGESVAFTGKEKSGLTWGKVSKEIINRGVTDAESMSERTGCAEMAHTMENREFPHLIGAIKRILATGFFDSVTLDNEELKLFQTLCRSNNLL
jgi:hypothetical protein